MRALNPREKRTVMIGTAAVLVYLAFYGGAAGWKSFAKQRADYDGLVKQAQTLRQQIQPYETKAQLAKKLMEEFRLDPAKLSKATLVAEASAAIQKAAATCGLQVGPVREEYSRGSTKELATIKIEGVGPVPALMAFINRLESLGFPLIIDTVQLGAEGGRQPGMPGAGGPSGPPGSMAAMGQSGPPGAVKLSLTIVILDFQQWKNEGANA